MPYTESYDPYYSQQSSGTLYMNMGGYYQGLKLQWSVISQNVLENSSTVEYVITVDSSIPEKYLVTNGATRVQLEVNFAVIRDFYFTEPGQVAYHTEVLTHNGYGQHEMGVSLYYYNYGDSPSSGATVIHNYDLPKIPQGAHLYSAPAAFNDEENPAIVYRSYQNTGTAVITTNTDKENLDVLVSRTLSASEAQVSYTFELTEEERDVLRLACKNSKSMKLYFGVYSSVSGNIIYSYKESTFSVINADQTATGTVKDINPVTLALTGDENTLIRFASTAAVSAQFTTYKKAAIKEYWIEHNSNIFNETYHEFENVEGNIFAFHITDSRGNIGESFVQCPTIDYTKLTCNLDTSEKPGTDGVMNLKCGGNYFNDTFGYTSAAVHNTLKVQYRYKLHGYNTTYTEWADMPFTINDDNTYEAAIVLDGFVYTNTYVFQCRAIDILSDVLTIEYIAKSLPVFHWGEDDFVFEVPVTFNAPTFGIEHPAPPPDYTYGGSMGGSLDITGDLDITGNLRLKGDGNYGNSIYFGDREYASIQELTDDTLTVTASTINLSGSVKINDQPLEFGVWYPTLSNSAVESYSENSGWYQRVGNVVSVGFFVKASCKTGYHTTGVTISGLPLSPAYAVAGGGMCAGTYVTANHNFQCWVAGTNGKITPRVQGCNQTTTSLLTTSASGMFYPQGGGEVTVSGTITYVVE